MSQSTANPDYSPAESYLSKMHQERFNIFKSQNPENEHFDVTFDIDGKTILANKLLSASASEYMNYLLSDRWTGNGEAVKIDDYCYDDFYQFLCFLYIGYCKLNGENIFPLIDISECYEHQVMAQKDIEEGEIFNVLNDVKDEFCATFPHISSLNKTMMSIDFLMNIIVENGFDLTPAEFITVYEKLCRGVAKGIFTVEEASQFYYIHGGFLYVRNNGKYVSGIIRDTNVVVYVNTYVPQFSTNFCRFINAKVDILSSPSTLKKTDGIDWYLCLDKEGVLTFKHYEAVDQSDYLITEMKSESEFFLTPNETTYFTSRFNYHYLILTFY
uniref:BTB domain-containing protein n=1 Tax=Panagrolaimus davidi TaxID=227884 RepID=A0A914PEN4_9BILA